MFVYIDESGVHQQDGKSAIALVYVITENSDELDRAVRKAEKSLLINSFHWSKYTWKIRTAFLNAILKEQFNVKTVLLPNPFTENKLEAALQYLLLEKNIKNVVIDGHKPHRYILRLKKILRDHGASVKKMRMGDDRSFPGL